MLKTKLDGLAPQKKKKLLIIITVVFAILALASFAVVKYKDKAADKGKVVFVVDGENYYEADLEPIIKYAYNRGLDRDEAAKEAFELYKKIKVSEKLGISPDDKSVQSEQQRIINEIAEGYNKADDEPWINLLARSNAIDNNIGTQYGYKGYAFDVFFGQHLQYGPSFKPEGLNSKELVTADRKYAEERANFYHKQLKENKMSAEEVIKALNNDRRLSALPDGKTSNSVKFGFSKSEDSLWSNEIFYQSIVDFVRNQQQTGISDIQVGKASVDGSASSLEDMYYYFVLLEEIPKGTNVTQGELEEQISNLEAQYIGYDS